MPFHLGIGFSNHPDALTAAQDAAKQAKAQLDQERIDIALFFNTAPYEAKEFLPTLYQSLQQTRLVGCQTSEIVLNNRYEPLGIGVLLLTSERIKFESGKVTHLAVQDLRAAGKTFVRDCVSGFGQSSRKLLLFFIDGLVNAPDEFVLGIQEEFGKALPVIGVGSNQSLTPQKTSQYHLDQILTDGASGLLLGEHVRFGISSHHGFKSLGKPRTITAAKDNIIQTIDGEKAIRLYQDLFQENFMAWDPQNLEGSVLRYPLGIRCGNQEFLIRNVMAKLDDGSLVCQDKISPGDTVHVLLGNKRSCLQAAEQAAYQVREQLGGTPPRLILVLTSVMRRALLGRSAAQELKIFHHILGENVPIFGLCSQREIFTTTYVDKNSRTDIQNSSMMVLAIG